MKTFTTKISFALCAILSAFLFFVGCSPSWQEIQAVRFNTDVYIAVKGEPVGEKEKILSYLSILETMLKTDGNSCVAQFNSAAPKVPVTVTEECAELLVLSDRYHELTQGKFIVAVRPASKLFKLSGDTFDGNPPEPFPTDYETEAIKLPTRFENVRYDYALKTLSKSVDDTEIDFGGIAKGYAVDKIATLLTQAGYTEGYINIGGSSLYIFSTPENLSVKHPRKNGELILSVSNVLTKNTPLSTSGDYERYYIKDGKRYSHIIDGVTARPADTGIASATVMGGTATLTDALSTALCCFAHTPEDISVSPLVSYMKLLLDTEEYKNLSFFVVYDDGNFKQILTNKKQGEDFTLLDGDYTVVEF